MQPRNAEAENGLQRIAARYEALARIKLDENRLDEADAFVSSGLAAWPQHAGLRGLRKQIAGQSMQNPGADEGYPESIQSYIAAARAGNATVQFQLALAFANGDGVAQDADEALYWFQEAAKQGHVKAEYNLALGKLFGPARDPESAGRWMESAADGEYRPAYRVLGWMYTTGTGVRKSAKDAVLWSARGTKWTRPPPAGDVTAAWQESFEDAYKNSIIDARDRKRTKAQGLK